MRVLVGCERSGIVREAFRRLGHDAWSCDTEPAEDRSEFHIEGDVLWFVENLEPFDLFIVHPPCTFLCSSGLHWNKRRPDRANDTERAYRFATRCISVPVERVCMENPIGCLSTRIRKPEQIIQPYQFGEDASKATCLWLNNLSKLVPTGLVAPRIVIDKKGYPRPRWANQTDSGQNKFGPSPQRSMDRARTYRGIADAMAMAMQWGGWMPHALDITKRAAWSQYLSDGSKASLARYHELTALQLNQATQHGELP